MVTITAELKSKASNPGAQDAVCAYILIHIQNLSD